MGEGTTGRQGDWRLYGLARGRLCDLERGRMGDSEITNYELWNEEFGEATGRQGERVNG